LLFSDCQRETLQYVNDTVAENNTIEPYPCGQTVLYWTGLLVENISIAAAVLERLMQVLGCELASLHIIFEHTDGMVRVSKEGTTKDSQG